jgi:hypothetical protein
MFLRLTHPLAGQQAKKRPGVAARQRPVEIGDEGIPTVTTAVKLGSDDLVSAGLTTGDVLST